MIVVLLSECWHKGRWWKFSCITGCDRWYLLTGLKEGRRSFSKVETVKVSELHKLLH
jgi:hypothetical protein